MALFEWNPKYSVGVELFDDQHKRLFSLLNQLHDGMHYGHREAILHTVLLELTIYIEEHFSAEEAAMAFHGYSGIAAHRAEHDKLRAEVQSFLRKCEAGELTLNVEIVNFVLEWLTVHIMKTDKEYSYLLGTSTVENLLAGWTPPMPAIAPTPPPSDAPPPTIELGQTKDQVTTALGQPVKIVKLGAKEIFYYKDLKVTFTAGKISNVE
jgi:hemerythrin-like metal-binding protein